MIMTVHGPRRGQWITRRAGLLLICGIALWVAAGCGSRPNVELPDPLSGEFLTLEQQRALSSEQLAEYCQVLNGALSTLRGDIDLAAAMTDSLDTVLDSLNGAHSRINREARQMETELRKLKSTREGATRYTTEEGDTLMSLASLFYGTAADWRKIHNANKDKITDPGAILPAGIELLIPR